MDPENKKDQTTDLTEEDLVKGLDQLNDFVAQHDAPTRKDELLKKAMGDEITEGERDELYKLMGGGEVETETRAEAIVKSMDDNENLQEAFEISDFLREQHGELVKSLSTLATHQEQAETRQYEFNVVMAKAVSDMGALVKSMSERLGVISAQPVRGPKGIQTQQDQVMQKSFANGSIQTASDNPNAQLTHGRILTAMDEMMHKSLKEGRSGMANCGEDLSVAVATFEQTKQVSPRLLSEIKEHLSAR